MGTLYSEIFDLFLISVQDYKIDRLFESARPTDMDVYLTGFLIKAIPNFDNCEKDLEDRDDTSRTFNVTLDTHEKVILSNLTRLEWLTKEINDIRQMHNHLSDTDFKIHSEERNLKGKVDLLNNTREDVERQMKRYSLKHIDWETDF